MLPAGAAIRYSGLYLGCLLRYLVLYDLGDISLFIGRTQGLHRSRLARSRSPRRLSRGCLRPG